MLSMLVVQLKSRIRTPRHTGAVPLHTNLALQLLSFKTSQSIANSCRSVAIDVITDTERSARDRCFYFPVCSYASLF